MSGDVGFSASGHLIQTKSNTIVFDATKNELYRTNDAYKSLQRKLKGKFFVSSFEEQLDHFQKYVISLGNNKYLT